MQKPKRAALCHSLRLLPLPFIISVEGGGKEVEHGGRGRGVGASSEGARAKGGQREDRAHAAADAGAAGEERSVITAVRENLRFSLISMRL